MSREASKPDKDLIRRANALLGEICPKRLAARLAVTRSLWYAYADADRRNRPSAGTLEAIAVILEEWRDDLDALAGEIRATARDRTAPSGVSVCATRHSAKRAA